MVSGITISQDAHRKIPTPDTSAEQYAQRQGDIREPLSNQASAPGATSLLAGSRLSGRGNAPVRASLMLAAQSTHGNRAVQRIVQRSADATVTVQRDADEEEVAKSVVGDAAVKPGDPTETDTMNDKEYAARMSGSTVEEPKSPGEGVVAPDKGSSAEEEARAEREKQDDKEIYERELRRAQQERIRDTSIPLNNVDEENLRGQVRDGAFTPLGGQKRLNPFGI